MEAMKTQRTKRSDGLKAEAGKEGGKEKRDIFALNRKFGADFIF